MEKTKHKNKEKEYDFDDDMEPLIELELPTSPNEEMDIEMDISHTRLGINQLGL